MAVLSASGLGGALPEASLSRRHLVPLVAAIAVVFAAAVAGGGPGGPPATDAAAVDFAVRPDGHLVRVVGIDGLDRRMAEQMIARGEMPHLQALLRVRGPRAAARGAGAGPGHRVDDHRDRRAARRPTASRPRARGAFPACGRPCPSPASPH